MIGCDLTRGIVPSLINTIIIIIIYYYLVLYIIIIYYYFWKIIGKFCSKLKNIYCLLFIFSLSNFFSSFFVALSSIYKNSISIILDEFQ